MGKGDQRTGKGKRFRGTYGNARPKPCKIRKAKEDPKKKG